MIKTILVFLFVGFCFSQDSTSVEVRIEEQMKELKDMRIQVQTTIINAQKQIEISEEDLGRIDYTEFVLKQLLDSQEQDID